MAFLLPFIPAIAEAVGTGALTGGAGYLAGSALKKLGFQKGGVIGGKRGAKQLIVAHGGEMILPAPMVSKVKAIMKKKGKRTTLPVAPRPRLPAKRGRKKGKKK